MGVCQDFAHVMIAGLRGLGLPAAYVSGYIRTVPPPLMAQALAANLPTAPAVLIQPGCSHFSCLRAYFEEQRA